MKRVAAIGVLGVALALHAGDPAEAQTSNSPPGTENKAAPGATGNMPMGNMPMGNMPMPSQTGKATQGSTYTTMGRVASVAADSVTINHEPVPALGWPSMTMTFRAPNAAILSGLATGTPVQFSFRQEGSQNVLTEITRR
jgi:Cu/Ag efflux protein CusF